jgi:outer membrane protein OmpA-like peptidoglycan-associated protein
MSDEGHPSGGQSDQGGTEVPFDEGLPSWSATRSGPPPATDTDTTVVEPTPPSPPVRVDVDAQARPAPPTPPLEPVAPLEPTPIAATPTVAAPEPSVAAAGPVPVADAIDPYLAAETEQVLPAKPLPVLEQDESRPRSRTPILLAGALVLALVALGIGWFIGSQGTSTDTSDEAQATSEATADDAAASADGVTTTTVVDDPASPTSMTVIGTVIPSTTVPSGPFVLPETPDNPSGATQYAVMIDGKAYLRGWYPDPEIAQKAVADAATIMGGMENVVDETQIDPRAEIRPDDFAVYLQDFVLFESDSAEITEEFHEFLGFPLFFMQNNPAARVTVVARTDASGTEAYNLALATRRAEAVRDFWLASGANADQIILDPRGEEGASEDADDAQAALDRRVELQVAGFLAG